MYTSIHNAYLVFVADLRLLLVAPITSPRYVLIKLKSSPQQTIQPASPSSRSGARESLLGLGARHRQSAAEVSIEAHSSPLDNEVRIAGSSLLDRSLQVRAGFAGPRRPSPLIRRPSSALELEFCV